MKGQLNFFDLRRHYEGLDAKDNPLAALLVGGTFGVENEFSWRIWFRPLGIGRRARVCLASPAPVHTNRPDAPAQTSLGPAPPRDRSVIHHVGWKGGRQGWQEPNCRTYGNAAHV